MIDRSKRIMPADFWCRRAFFSPKRESVNPPNRMAVQRAIQQLEEAAMHRLVDWPQEVRWIEEKYNVGV